MTTLLCNRNLYKLIHKLQVQAFERTGIELTMEEALELFLISKLSNDETKTKSVHQERSN